MNLRDRVTKAKGGYVLEKSVPGGWGWVAVGVYERLPDAKRELAGKKHHRIIQVLYYKGKGDKNGS